MSRAICSVCLRSFSVTSTGLVRAHGPLSCRCSGSNQPPAPARRPGASPAATAPRGDDAQLSPPVSAPTVPSNSESSPPFSFRPSKILKRIPRASREQCLSKLATILEGVVTSNSLASWERLIKFPARCLRIPSRCGRRWSLATMVNRQLIEEEDPPPTPKKPSRRRVAKNDPIESLGKRVSAKLEEGDFRGAVRLACSEDSLAEKCDATFSALEQKHPSPHPDSSIPPTPDVLSNSMDVSEAEVVGAIRSFPCGSAGGPDGLRPQHLKDLINHGNGQTSSLLSSLAAFTTLVLEGRTPPSVRPFFFGATLTALNKKGGGVRPIAVGCTLRRLVAKVAGNKVREDMVALLAPRQLGYGVRGGVEAAVHATRQYLSSIRPDHVVVKLDFRNAFNSVHRDSLLKAVQNLVPDIYPFVHSVYSSPSSLFWGDKSIKSAEGVQQGDPLGPLLFCLALHGHGIQLMSELCVLYLDDISLGGSTEEIVQDLKRIESAAEIGLELNNEKSEIITNDPVSRGTVLCSLPGAKVVDPSDACLLGSPLGNIASVSDTLGGKINALEVMGDRLRSMSAHDALILLRNSFSIPKLLHVLRTSPTFLSPALNTYDESLKSIVSSITNIKFGPDDPAWTQATLPIGVGGLGIRSAVQLAPSAFLASAAASRDLVNQILPLHLQSLPTPYEVDALSSWSSGHHNPPPSGTAACAQKTWDAQLVTNTVDSLLQNAPHDVARARLLAVTAKESGAWLKALPVSSLGLRMDDSTIRVAVGLRLGSVLCHPHACQRCDVEVDQLGTHGLSCKKSEGRHYRHSSMNDILHRALRSAKVPARLEPSGLTRSDGKRPDGMTMVPWRNGKPLVWDATCPDTLAQSYRANATSGAGAVAAMAEGRKMVKYDSLASSYNVVPVAIESLGAIGPLSKAFLKDLGGRIQQQTGEARAHEYLLQRLAVAVQRGNAISILGSVGDLSGPDIFSE